MPTERDIIPLAERACDLCSRTVVAEDHSVVASFVLTDWGVICIVCWDHRIERHEEFRILKVYIVSQTVGDEWITHQLVLDMSAIWTPTETMKYADWRE